LRKASDYEQPRGLVAVLRGSDLDKLELAARALADGGLRAIEVTMTIPGAETLIDRLASADALFVGVGTVMTIDQAERAIDCGARFVVSPVCNPELVQLTNERGVACILGGLTPTEISKAWEAGAAQVKVFPIARVGGPAFLADLAGPFPDILFMPSGGINIDNIARYRRPNVGSIGLGSDLTPRAAVAEGNVSLIRQQARKAREAYGAD
jgi:2-dehydro-3-deoxyphosphogluconate aldolase/(4S)-4-hydroxy-2-oxoglutarate aldolase